MTQFNSLSEITDLSSLSEPEFIDLVQKELSSAYDKQRAIDEINERLTHLAAASNNLLLIFKLKFIYSSTVIDNEKLTVSEIASEYKKSNKTVLSWIKEKGLQAEQVVDDYYVTRKDLKNWINKKAWSIPQAKRISKSNKAFFFFRAAA